MPNGEPLLIKLAFGSARGKKQYQKPECVSGDEGKCEESMVGLGSFPSAIKMCVWKLGVDFMSKYGILPPNSFLQS